MYLRSLTRCVIRVTPQDDLPDLVQNAVSPPPTADWSATRRPEGQASRKTLDPPVRRRPMRTAAAAACSATPVEAPEDRTSWSRLASACLDDLLFQIRPGPASVVIQQLSSQPAGPGCCSSGKKNPIPQCTRMYLVWYINTRFRTSRYILFSVCTSRYIDVYTFGDKYIPVYTWKYDLGPICTIASYKYP